MRVLFICKSNVGRSQMAEAFFLRNAPEHEAMSAGVSVTDENEGKPISVITEKVIECMEEVGLEVASQVMNKVTPEQVAHADKVVSMVSIETLPSFVVDSGKLELWSVPDAGGTDMERHREIRDAVLERVESLTESL